MGVGDDFQAVGRDLFLSGAVTTHGGNLSVRRGDRVLITRRGSMLGRLTDDDIVDVPLADDGVDRPEASRELVVHRAIYQATDAAAVVHAHPPYTIACSLTEDEIVSLDSEARLLLGTVPVLAPETLVGSPEAAGMLAGALAEHPIAVLRSHGPFSRGETLEEAFMWVSILEAACKIRVIAGRLGG
jgi:L-fuculose-phosphate aldolase